MNYRDIIIENLQIGDIHYEYVVAKEIICEVVTQPVFDEASQTWTWTSKNTLTGNEIYYRVSEGSSEITLATDDTL